MVKQLLITTTQGSPRIWGRSLSQTRSQRRGCPPPNRPHTSKAVACCQPMSKPLRMWTRPGCIYSAKRLLLSQVRLLPAACSRLWRLRIRIWYRIQRPKWWGRPRRLSASQTSSWLARSHCHNSSQLSTTWWVAVRLRDSFPNRIRWLVLFKKGGPWRKGKTLFAPLTPPRWHPHHWARPIVTLLGEASRSFHHRKNKARTLQRLLIRWGIDTGSWRKKTQS